MHIFIWEWYESNSTEYKMKILWQKIKIKTIYYKVPI